jgi:hypothetical protein
MSLYLKDHKKLDIINIFSKVAEYKTIYESK